MVFDVVSKETDIQYTVFDVRDGEFLIYANGYFQYQDMNLFYMHKGYRGTHKKVDPRKSLFKSVKEEEEVI